MDPLGGKDTMKGYDLLKPFGRIICFGNHQLQMLELSQKIVAYSPRYLDDSSHLTTIIFRTFYEEMPSTCVTRYSFFTGNFRP